MSTATLFASASAGTLRPPKYSLRPYQEHAVARALAEFDRGRRSTLLVMPTGTGKTTVFGHLIRRMVEERGVRALVLAHRGELIGQAADRLHDLGLDVGVEQAGSRARAMGEPHAVVGTVQTLQGRRLALWPRDYFGLITTDEAHHAVADTYSNVYDHFRGVPHLGVTATADRGDKVNLGAVFESVAFEYTLLDAMTAPEPGPYLCRLSVAQCEIGIDLRDIRTTAGDLNAADLEDALRPHIEPIANAVKREIGDRPTLAFTPDVDSATAVASALRSLGVAAEWASGDDPDRARKVRDFRDGPTQVLVNCALLVEGFDAPRTAAVVLCRPTKSRALFAQIVGRGLRPHPGKTDCLLVDFAWIAGRHQLVKPVELLAARLTQDEDDEAEVRSRAQKLLDLGEETDLLDAIERARREAGEEGRRRALELAVRERPATYRRVRYDPLAGYRAFGLPTHFREDQGARPATEKQVAALRAFGLPVGDDVSFDRARALLDVMFARKQDGRCSYKQANWLIANGYDPAAVAAMARQEASEVLSRLWGKGGRN